MESSRVCGRWFAAPLIAFGIGLGSVTTSFADPGQTDPPPPQPAPVSAPGEGDAATPAVSACRQFAAAVRVSSTYYNKFAYSIAGDGAIVDYQDPTVMTDNVEGRSALRKAAAEALNASATPGLQPEIANPIRAWALQAAKLVIVMGVRGDGNTLNNAATELNREAANAQMACAKAGAQPVSRRSQEQP